MTSMPLTSRRMEAGAFMFRSTLQSAARDALKRAPSGPAPPSRREGLGREQPCLAKPDVGAPRSRLAIGGAAPRQLLFADVFVRGSLHHRLDDLLVGLEEVGRHSPLRAVPGLDARPGRAHVVGARSRDWPQDAGEAERVELLLVERQVLQAPAHLLGGHDLALAEALLRAPHAFDGEHLDHDAARVENRADLVLRARALALLVDELEDVLDHLRLLPGGMQGE